MIQYAAIALAAAGALTKFIGGITGATKTKALAQMNADLIKWEGENEVARLRQESRALLGAQISGFAKGGVLTTEGTAADVISNTALQSERDALALKYDYLLRSKIVKKGGALQASQMKFGAVGGLFSSAGSLIGGMGGGK